MDKNCSTTTRSDQLDKEQLKKYPFRLGISAEVNVTITNQDLPMLAQAPATKVVGSTHVFDINLSEVNQMMDQIIKTNLSPHEQ